MNYFYLVGRAFAQACLLAVGAAPVFATASTTAPTRDAEVNRAELLSLAVAIERALAASPRIEAAEQTVLAAEGAQQQAGLRLNPVLQFEAENIAGTGAYRALDGSVYTLSVAQELELGGRRQHRQDAAGAGTALAQHEQHNARLQVIMAVRIAYARVIAAQQRLELAQEHQRVAQALMSEIEKRVQAGVEPQLQLSKAQIALARAGLLQDEQEREVMHAQHVLASFWFGRHEAVDYDSSPFFSLVPPVPETQLEAALRRHPALQYWHSDQQKQQALMRLTQAEATPNPSLALGVRQFEETGDQALVVGLSMPLPVFNRNQGALRTARAELARSASNQKTRERELIAQGLQVLEEMTNAYHRARALAAGIIPAAERAFALAREGYLAGRFPYLEVLDAQRALFDAKQDHIGALEQYQVAKAEVEFVMANDIAPTTDSTPDEQ